MLNIAVAAPIFSAMVKTATPFQPAAA